MLRIGLTSLFILAALPLTGAAQYVPTQDLSLKGLSKVDLAITIAVSTLPPDTATALNHFTELELRKAGLVLLSARSDEFLKPEGRLRVSLASQARGRFTDDLLLRIHLEQTATLARTGETMTMVTWFVEETNLNVPTTESTQAARLLLTKGLDRFVRSWFQANGR
jgi:hypothetical protein